MSVIFSNERRPHAFRLRLDRMSKGADPGDAVSLEVTAAYLKQFANIVDRRKYHRYSSIDYERQLNQKEITTYDLRIRRV